MVPQKMRKVYICLIMMMLSVLGYGEEGKELSILAGAGLKKPMVELAEKFERDNDVKIVFSYGGSGQLVSQLNFTNKGDLFFVGSVPVYKSAQEKGLVEAPKLVAYHTPVIAVRKGNPKQIMKLEDLGNENIKLILGDKEANAVGKTTQAIFKKNNLENINKNVIASGITVNEMVLQFENSQADAMIVTKDSIYSNDKFTLVEIAPEQNIDQIISGGIIVSSENKELGEKFLEYVVSEEGQKTFEKYGFARLKNEK